MNHLLKNLLYQATPDRCQPHSRLDYQAPGMDYLCLHRSPELTLKIYVFEPERLVTCGNRDYLVNPHDHGYNFETTVLVGKMSNVRFFPKPEDPLPLSERTVLGNVFYEPSCKYKSYLYNWREKTFSENGETELVGVGGVYQDKRGFPFASLNDSYYHCHDEIHTICIPADRVTVLLLKQFADHPKLTRLFTNDGPPDLSKVNRKPTLEETTALIERVREVLR